MDAYAELSEAIGVGPAKMGRDVGRLALLLGMLRFAQKAPTLLRFAFYLLALTSGAVTLVSCKHNTVNTRAFASLMRCFTTCLVPLCFVLQTLTLIEGFHTVAKREQLFVFNFCFAFPVVAFLRKPRPVQFLLPAEYGGIMCMAAISLAAHAWPVEGMVADAAADRINSANRVLLASGLWASSWFVDEVGRRLPSQWLRHFTPFCLALLEGVSKGAACAVLRAPVLPSDLDFFGWLLGQQ